MPISRLCPNTHPLLQIKACNRNNNNNDTGSKSVTGKPKVSPQLNRWSRARAIRAGRKLDRSSPRTQTIESNNSPPPVPFAVDLDDTVSEDGSEFKAKSIYIVSDGTGWTAEHCVNAALGQFDYCLVDRGCPVCTHMFSGIDDVERLLEIIKQAVKEDALVVYTLADSSFSSAAEKACKLWGVPSTNVLGPITEADGQMYGLQQYQYPCSYYNSPTSADGSFAPNKTSGPQREMSTAVNADRIPSNVMNKGNSVSMVNGDCTNQNGLKAFMTSSQHTSLNTRDSYQGSSLPACAPLSGYQGPRLSTHGAQSAIPTDVSLVSDRQSKHGGKVGLSSQVANIKDFSSQRNQRHSQPLPQFMNLNGSRHPSGMELLPGFMNGMYPSNNLFSQYGSTFRANSCYGSSAYGSRTGSFDNKYRATGNGYVANDSRRNGDGFSELNKGPRAAKSSDNKSVKSPGPVTLLLKGQNLPVKSDDEVVPLVLNKEQYNGEDLSENYSDAKFFIIKSYSEDDVHKSIKYSVWASTPNGNKKLDAAYQEAGGCPIFLLFSVNTSGQFVGLAEMTGPVDFDKTVEYWQQDRWTGCFNVKWHIIKDIPNGVLRHITLENNENKPVTNSRDTQEVKFEKGVQIVKIFKEHASKTSILDDFGFYESREKTTQERKFKEPQLPKQVNKASDITFGSVTLPKSLATTLMKESATADAAQGKVNSEVLLERNGSTPAFEDSSKSS